MPLSLRLLLKSKSPGIDSIPPEVIKAGGKTLHSVIHQFINSIWSKEELCEEWKELIDHCTFLQEGQYYNLYCL